MGLPSGKITPQGDEPQSNTETPNNVITWEQVQRHIDLKFEALSSEIKDLESRADKKMEESEKRSKEYTDAQVDSIQTENRKHIASVEVLVGEVVSNVNKRLDKVINGIEQKLGQWNTLFTSAQHSISNIHSIASDLQAGQRDLEKGQRQQAHQIDNLQEKDEKHSDEIRTLRSGQAATDRRVDNVDNRTMQNATLLKKFEDGFAPMNEFFSRQLEAQNARRRFRASVRNYLLNTRQGTYLIGVAIGAVTSFIAENTGIDTEGLRKAFFQFIESIFLGE